MGERKGQNKYYPPDFDPAKHGNLNRYHGTHALRERASKIHLGILTIRFEMPFNVWCEGCSNHVGMGVRYNAEKKKVGNYYSTPIYEFRMKCHLCENYFEIRTDPKNFDYELVSGVRRQEKRWDPSTIGQVAAIDREASQKLATDAMYKLEHGTQDKLKSEAAAPRLEQLEWMQNRMKDDFAANQLLRHKFRDKKKSEKEQEAQDADLLKRSSLGDLRLLPENEDDKKMASLLSRYRTVNSVEEKQHSKREEIYGRSIFAKPDPTSPSPSRVNQLRNKLSLSVGKRKSEALKRRSTIDSPIVAPKSSKTEETDANNEMSIKTEQSNSTEDHCVSVSGWPLIYYSDSDSE